MLSPGDPACPPRARILTVLYIYGGVAWSTLVALLIQTKNASPHLLHKEDGFYSLQIALFEISVQHTEVTRILDFKQGQLQKTCKKN